MSNIFKYLPAKDLENVAQVNKHFRRTKNYAEESNDLPDCKVVVRKLKFKRVFLSKVLCTGVCKHTNLLGVLETITIATQLTLFYPAGPHMLLFVVFLILSLHIWGVCMSRVKKDIILLLSAMI